MTSPPPHPLVFSTDAFDHGDPFDAWRETFALALALARVDIETPDPTRFRASATVHNFDAMRLIAFDLGPMSISRTADLLRDGDDGFSLVLCMSGAGHGVGPDGDGAPLSPGRAVLIPHYVQGGTVACGDETELSLVVPRESFAPGDPGPRCRRRLHAVEPCRARAACQLSRSIHRTPGKHGSAAC